jgi:hypothetical protein
LDLSLDKDCPDARPIQPANRGKVIAIPQLGGLHHRYERVCGELLILGKSVIRHTGEFANDLGGPFVPTWKVMNHDHARILSRRRRTRVVSVAALAIEALELHSFGLNATKGYGTKLRRYF